MIIKSLLLVIAISFLRPIKLATGGPEHGWLLTVSCDSGELRISRYLAVNRPSPINKWWQSRFVGVPQLPQLPQLPVPSIANHFPATSPLRSRKPVHLGQTLKPLPGTQSFGIKLYGHNTSSSSGYMFIDHAEKTYTFVSMVTVHRLTFSARDCITSLLNFWPGTRTRASDAP